MPSYSLKWPSDFEDYVWELESKGWFTGLEITLDGKKSTPVFYDEAGLRLEIAHDISSLGCSVIPV